MFNFGDVDFSGVYFVFIHLELAPICTNGARQRADQDLL